MALTLQKSVKDPRQAQTLTVKGMAYEVLGKYEEALKTYEDALKLQQEDLQGQAGTLTKMGDAYAALGKSDEALEKFKSARELWHSFGEREGEGLALVGAARVERKRGNLAAALKQTEAALELIEPLRSNITDRQLRASYFAAKVGYYELYIDMLMRAGGEAQTVAAFEASGERARGACSTCSRTHASRRWPAQTLRSRRCSKNAATSSWRCAPRSGGAGRPWEKKGAEVVAALDHESRKLDLSATARRRRSSRATRATPRSCSRSRSARRKSSDCSTPTRSCWNSFWARRGSYVLALTAAEFRDTRCRRAAR